MSTTYDIDIICETLDLAIGTDTEFKFIGKNAAFVLDNVQFVISYQSIMYSELATAKCMVFV